MDFVCISLGSAEFKGTVIANFPQSTNNEQERALSYMNSVLSAGTPSADGMADSSPNAMVFPVYGEVTGVLDCDDPVASRQWLAKQEGVYYESWEDWSATRASSGPQGVEISGNYLVSIAADIEDIPRTLHRLKQGAVFPNHVPEVSDHTLEWMNRFYQAQGLGIPQFVIAAFALPPHHIDRKNPVTITYNQFDSVADKTIFPALDYHGEGEFQTYVKRDHTLLLSTNALSEVLGSVMHASTDSVPSEFRNAPRQFPISVLDLRNPKNELGARAPNNDYIFDIAEVHTKLQGAQAEIEALPHVDVPESRAYYERRKQIINIMIRHLGRYGVMGHSNQPATTAQGLAESCYGDTFVIGDLLQEDIED